MAVEMIMPKVDMDQETGTVVEWHKQNGDEVKEGEIILVIETDKVAIDVESPGTGILDGINVGEGDTVPIGTVIAYVLDPGEELPQSAAAEAEEAQPDLPEAHRKTNATPVAAKMAEAYGMDVYKMSGSGKKGKVTKADVEKAVAHQVSTPSDEDTIASPAARRIAREKGVNLSDVPGSGPAGRIQGFDVDAYQPGTVVSELEASVIPLKGMRKRIAERMTASYQSIPHIKFTSRVDMTNFNQTRTEMNAAVKQRGGQKISATALFVKLVAQTLTRHPWLNSSFTEDEIILHGDVNIGVAVALDEGLIVPVVMNADRKRVSQLAAEIADLAGRARSGQLTSSEVKGGTFTISNLGPFGVEKFEAIINPPEAAILAIGGTFDEVVPTGPGSMGIRPVMYFTLSADHRVVDGAVAAQFVADLQATLQNPNSVTL